ncbi:MAG TPA: amidohydrolase [Terriglobales bacterium]|nr:amidohydrolase [Terriglobales bacterium]
MTASDHRIPGPTPQTDNKELSREPQPADLLILGGTVLTIDARHTVHEDGAVAIGGDQILAVGPRVEIEQAYRGRRVLRGEGHLVLPGLVNAHTHVPMTLFRGVSDDQELMAWLEGYIFPLESRFVTAEFVYWAALLACWEMIASGTTTFADGYFFEDNVARAVEQAGLRAVLGQGVLDLPTPDAPNSSAALARAEALLLEWRGHPRISPAVAPHSCFTVGPDTFRRVQSLAAKYDARVMVHAAESQMELNAVRQRYQATPVRHLASLGLLEKNWVAAHCVWVDEEEISLLAETEVGVVHCAESNMKLASGVAPVPQMLAAGVRVGLGTDGPASNNDLDMFGEMATVAKLHKVHTLDPTQLPARTVLRMATVGGAAALHLENQIGSLEPGKKADVILVDTSGPNAIPYYNPDSHLAYAARADAVQTVVVGGKVLMENRQLCTLDTEEIRAQCLKLHRAIVEASSAKSALA